MKPIFHDTVNYDSVDIRKGANWNPVSWIAHAMGHPAIALGNNVYFKRNKYCQDFSATGVGSQSLLVHEIVHVWQKQTNPNYSEIKAGIEGLKGIAAYEYVLSPSDPASQGPMKPLTVYGFEQQAQIVEDYFLNGAGYATLGNKDVSAGPDALNTFYERALGASGLGRDEGQSVARRMPIPYAEIETSNGYQYFGRIEDHAKENG